VKPRLDPTIATARLVLRLPRMGDVDDLVAGIGDPAVARMLARIPLPYRRSDGEGFVALARQHARQGTNLHLLIVHDGRPVGGIGIADMPPRCEFGYWLARPDWGRGLATEAGTAVLAYGFEVLGLKLIRSGVYTENRGSLRVQQKLGFAAIGRSLRTSLARGCAVPHIETVLTRARFQALAR
jgi:RimJ/RimL family protein N-acetyltransferase